MRNTTRRITAALRLLFPSARELFYVFRIRRSRLFDRQFYLSTNTALHPFCRYFPERHYIQRGERMGLRPNPEFSPFGYLRNNPDLKATGVPPFLHYITHGRHENRITKDLADSTGLDSTGLPVLRQPRTVGGARALYAVVVHIYYHDLWPEIAASLAQQGFAFDLFVSYTRFQDEPGDLRAEVLRDFPNAVVVAMPNRGRDIFPFVHMVNSGLLSRYRAVCKIHTKKSPHREDGERWRRHLIAGILGDSAETQTRLERFLARDDAAIWAADGQHYTGKDWWGTNTPVAEDLLKRVDIRPDPAKLSFPAGSMYWVKPLVLEMIRGLHLSKDDFEPEFAQVDGTIAHAFERALGYFVQAAGQRIVQSTELEAAWSAPSRPRPTFTSAFYLPQFHPVPENDLWWGQGFTEWHGVARATPAWLGHFQPALPTALGFYDLRVAETLAAQAAMARTAGVDAFCVYHYWFDGRRILERPIDMVLATPGLDFPFYLCWANESWRRNWDGLSGEVLLDQPYRPGFARTLAESLVGYFADPRYQRPDGVRPRFVIYRPEDMPDPAASVAEMRAVWREAGVGEVELGAVRFHIAGTHPVAAELFDFWIEMPPHGLVRSEDYLFGGPDGNRLGEDPAPEFHGLIYDYTALADTSTSARYVTSLPGNTIAGIMPSWDNTARRGLSAHIAHGANPASFSRWLERLLSQRLTGSYRHELFINAWNEWAEKAMLEPGEQYDAAYLRVLADRIGPQQHQS